MLHKSGHSYRHPAKQAVIDRYNALHDASQGEPVDFGKMFAELIHAYMQADSAIINAPELPQASYHG